MSELRLGVRQLHDHFALPLLPLVQELGLKGIPFDTGVRDANVRSIQSRLLDIDARLMSAGINNPNSTKKLNEDLVCLGVPLTKKTASGAQFTVDLDVLGRIHHNYNVNLKAPKYPFLPDLITRKRLEKARANLESLRPCKDGKLRTALRSTGTETGRYSSAGLRWCNVCQEPSHGCLLPEAEVLTKTGWVKFKDITGDSITAAIWRDGQVYFQESSVYRGYSCGHVWKADSWFHKQVYTNGHTIPMHGSVGSAAYDPSKISGRQVEVAATWGQFMLPLSGEYRPPTTSLPPGISVAHMRLLVALQADGSFEKSSTCARWAFKKKRKSERLLALAAEAGIELTECVTKPGYRRFYMNAEDGKWFKQMLGSEKNFGSWLLEIPFEVLKAMIEETKYWDATVRNKSWMYFTTNENNAEWIQTCAHLVGYSATKRVNRDNNRGYGVGENKPLYTIAIKPRSYARVCGADFKRAEYKGPVYCLQTTTGYFLTRYDGVISVTGNTNLQNIGKNNKELGVNIKDCFVAPAGHVFWEIDHCVAPDTKVLKSDLTWVPAHSLNTGDELIGFDEEYEDSRKGRKFRRSKVIKIKKIIEPSVVVKTSKGDVTCSEKHRWLVSYGSKYSWVEAKDIKPGMLIAYFGRTWETRKDYDAGWMAGFLDGEGWISNSACGFGQNFGPIYDKACKYLEEEDLSNQAYKSVRGKLGMVHLARMRDSLRLLGSVRPTRLLSKASKLWEGKKIWGKWTEPALVIDVSSVGKKEVIAIGTETHTFIANGFLSHNSMLELRIMAHVAGVKKLIERLEDPTCNIHKENTLEMFDGRYNDGLRTLSKNLFYAMQYGGSEQAIQMALAKKGEYLDQDFIRSLMLKIFMVYPEIALWQQRVTAECARLTKLGLPRIARNAYGGCRILLGADPTKEWLSTIVQGTAAYTMSFALLRMSEDVRRPIIAQIHDAFLGMSPQETWREEMQAVMDEMTRPIWICDKFVKLPADAKVGQTWATMTAVED